MSDLSVAAAEKLAELESFGELCPSVHALVRARDPKHYTDATTHLHYTIRLPLRNGPTPELIEFAGRLIEMEKTHRKGMIDLAQRAEAAIHGKAFDDDPLERGSQAWAAKIVRGRHENHRDLWQRSGEKIVAILEGQ